MTNFFAISAFAVGLSAMFDYLLQNRLMQYLRVEVYENSISFMLSAILQPLSQDWH